MSKPDNEVKASRRALEKIDKAYAAEIDTLKSSKAGDEAIQIAHSEWAWERSNEEYILDNLLTQKLRSRARKLDVPLPNYPIYNKDAPDWDHTEHWYRSPVHGGFVLTQRGRDYVADALWKKEERGYNRWVRWVSLAIGLIGTLTGLVSVTASNWEKFSRLWPHR